MSCNLLLFYARCLAQKFSCPPFEPAFSRRTLIIAIITTATDQISVAAGCQQLAATRDASSLFVGTGSLTARQLSEIRLIS